MVFSKNAFVAIYRRHSAETDYSINVNASLVSQPPIELHFNAIWCLANPGKSTLVNRVCPPGKVDTAGQAFQSIQLKGNDSDIKTDNGQPSPHHVDRYFNSLYLIYRITPAAQLLIGCCHLRLQITASDYKHF
jgi:hypothetical protein